MNPPARPIRDELNDALIGGIRQRGADAVGLVIMAGAYLVIALLVLLVLLLSGSVFGVDRTAAAVSLMSLVSAMASWLIGKSIRGLFDGEGERPATASEEANEPEQWVGDRGR